MDFEDFKFQPMTQGLGFDKQTEPAPGHKKSSRTPKTLDIISMELEAETQELEPSKDKEYAPVSRSLKKMLDSLPPSMDFIDDSERVNGLQAPIAPVPSVAPPPSLNLEKQPMVPPSSEAKQGEAPSLPSKGFDVSLNNSIESAFPKVEFQKSFYHQKVTPKLKFKEVPTSFTSAIIDGGVCLGLTLALVTLVVALTSVDVNTMLASQVATLQTLLDIAILFLGSTAVYYTVSRSLFGSTLGDWAFDVQLGTRKQRRHLMYPLQVLFRCCLIMATGFLLIPLISLGFRKDIAHTFSGLRLYMRQY